MRNKNVTRCSSGNSSSASCSRRRCSNSLRTRSGCSLSGASSWLNTRSASSARCGRERRKGRRAGRVQRDQHLGHAVVGTRLRHQLEHEAQAVAGRRRASRRRGRPSRAARTRTARPACPEASPGPASQAPVAGAAAARKGGGSGRSGLGERSGHGACLAGLF